MDRGRVEGGAPPRRRRRKPKLLVLGVGNPLLGDDGIGGAAIAHLEGERLPARVELRDAGTSMIDVVTVLGRYERVIVIDAVAIPGRARGSVVEFELADAAVKGALPAISAHEFELGGLMALAAALALELPPVHVIGFVPVSIELGRGLSPAAVAALDDIVARVLRLVHDGGGRDGEGRDGEGRDGEGHDGGGRMRSAEAALAPEAAP